MLLEGKRLLVTGVLTDSSIAFSVARCAQEQVDAQRLACRCGDHRGPSGGARLGRGASAALLRASTSDSFRTI